MDSGGKQSTGAYRSGAVSSGRREKRRRRILRKKKRVENEGGEEGSLERGGVSKGNNKAEGNVDRDSRGRNVVLMGTEIVG